ncbi:MAG: peptidase T, partial [Tissierellia bacterium]|nr:peptidase T [Tissierellia bacterium]
PHRFDVEDFGADFAYTIDGGPLGELEYENFNAAGAELDFIGVSVHPGSAKNQMVNALNMAMEFEAALPKYEKPWYTTDYEGFYLLTNLSGGIGQAKSNYIIRDHDMKRFLDKKAYMEKLVEEMQLKYGADKVRLKMEDSYYNMKEKIEPVIFVVDYAKEAMENLGISPVVKAIRGGTDGAQLSFKGLPCPNIFSGGENYHGPYEFISIESMNRAVDVIVEIVRIYLEKGKN